MIKDENGNEISVDELDESMEDLSGVYDQLYDDNGNYIGPEKYRQEEYIPGMPDPSEFISNKKDFEFTPSNLRAHFLERAAPLIDEYIEGAFDRKRVDGGNQIAKNEVWTMLKEIIMAAKNIGPAMDLRGKEMKDQVDIIMTLVQERKLSPTEGSEYIALIQQGYEATELPQIMEQMKQLEALGVLK